MQANISLLTFMFESHAANEDPPYNNPWTLRKWNWAIPPGLHWIQLTPFQLTLQPELQVLASVKLRIST
ncbi:hypothetical protein I79_014284 [Cricetulus griseus]|uniref:Uncharacterized protein n=1 Tax=Cricetulus griseus TaxID=10029 RepID=G3HTQ6_CRIGR|nr:hypothetical protein I79_014284 [Cricetulus griseus]